MTSRRTSNRAIPRKKYTVDAFDGIEELQSEISSVDEREDQGPRDDSDEDADDFEAENEPSEVDDDDDVSVSEHEEAGPVRGANPVSSDAEEQAMDEILSATEDPDQVHPTKTPTRSRIPVKNAQGERLYVRGIHDDQTNSIKSTTRQIYLYGPGQDEFRPVRKAYIRWNHELCLPSRHSSSATLGGFAYGEAFEVEIKHAGNNWRWYDNGGKEAFRQRQVLVSLSASDACKYLPVDGTGERSFVAGPLSAQKFFRCQPNSCISLSDAFHVARQIEDEPSQHTRSYKSGFLINMGARVNCLEWAPSQRGAKQYLAASLLPRQNIGDLSEQANSFAPQPASETSIQVWEFTATEDNYIDKTKPPRLSIVICARMGLVKAMKWCPVPFTEPDKLGLLACVAADGALRIFDIPMSSSDSGTETMNFEKPAFEVKPPDTICTSVSWLSSCRVVASCANGFIAVWDLSRSPYALSQRPVHYLGVSTSYISSVASGYPSFPNIIMTNAITGHLTLTDLSRPKPASPTGTVVSPRSRLSQLLVVWHDFGRMALSCEDNLSVRAHPVRRWFGVLGTNRLKSHATSMAVSLCHPFVLVGTAGGEAVSHNPMGRMVQGLRTELMLQPWFLHEWRRPDESERTAAESTLHVRHDEAFETEALKAVIGRDGLSRIVDGLRAYTTTLAVKDGNATNFRNGVQFNTVYEEKTAVTSVAWNPNLHVAGWAAAGMADGLLRVEDIAI